MMYPYIVIPALTWFAAQLIKFLINLARGTVSFKYFYNSGGMPSAHSATVSSLVMLLVLREGLDSPLTGIAVVFTAVVIYDSLGVRRSGGEHSTAINAIINFINNQKPKTPMLAIREVLGHKPLEVVAGVALGIVSAMLLNSL